MYADRISTANDLFFFLLQVVPKSDSASHSFSVEMEALSVVRSSSEHEPHVCSELPVSGLSPPSEQLLDDADKTFNMSNDDFRDLGDALVSILGSPAKDKDPLSEQSPQFTPVITHSLPSEVLRPPLSADTLPLPDYSPPASSIASSSSYDDIASILGEDKSPASVQDIAETASSEEPSYKRRKPSASSESEDENPTAHDSQSGKAIKLPQSK